MSEDSEHRRRMGSDRKGITEYSGPGGALKLLWMKVLYNVGLDLSSFGLLLNEYVHKTYGSAKKPGSAKVDAGRIDAINTTRANLRRSLTQHPELTIKKLVQGLKVLGLWEVEFILKCKFPPRPGFPQRTVEVSTTINLGKVTVELDPPCNKPESE